MSEIPQFHSSHEGTEFTPDTELDFTKNNPDLKSLAVIRAARDAHAAALSRDEVQDTHETLPVLLPSISEIGDTLEEVRRQYRKAA